MEKRGQVTIFIMIGVLIVGLIAIFFALKGGTVKIKDGSYADMNLYLKTCIKERMDDGLRILLLQGGSIENPLNRTFAFDGEETHEVSYLCYTNEDNKLCTNQESVLTEHMNDEIYDYVSGEVGNCLNEMKLDLEGQGYDAKKEDNGFEVKFTEGRVIVKINSKITLTKAEESSTTDGFEFYFPTKIYDLSVIAQKIVNEETRDCDFNYGLFMRNYPEFTIRKVNAGDDGSVYGVEDRQTREEFRFAIRGCII